MNFNKIIDELGIYCSYPEINKKTMKQVVSIFFNGMSNQEKEVFKKRCANFNFDLFELLELPQVQTRIDKFSNIYKKFRKINL